MMPIDVTGSIPEETGGMKHIMHAILHLLDRYNGFACPSKIASDLAGQGMAVPERTVRHYLKKLDSEGLTAGGTSRNRTITEKGRRELTQSFTTTPACSIITRISSLSALTDFDAQTGRGRVILNVSCVPEHRTREALHLMNLILCSPYILSERVVLARAGEAIGDLTIPEGLTGIGTVCSMTFNGVFMRSGIPVFPRLGGVLQIEGKKPVSFHDFISYQCSSVAPLEIILKSGMTEVRKTVSTGSGSILGSFREIPATCADQARDLVRRLGAHGFKDTIIFGEPGRPLLGIPVPDGRLGIIVPGGTNAHAALHEAGVSVSLQALAALYPYEGLSSVKDGLDDMGPPMDRDGDPRTEGSS
jgi:HTH-type transcriptional regulator, global nitrogen regulator NrpRI